MARLKDTKVEQVLTELFSAEWIETQARELGVVKRIRKIDPSAIFWTLVLGFDTGAHRSLGGLRRAFCQAVGIHVSRSSFYERFTPALALLMQRAVDLASNTLLLTTVEMEPILDAFKDVVIADGTVVRLYKLLKDKFTACKENQAAAKLNIVMSVFGQTPTKFKLSSQRQNEGKLLSIGPWVAGRLLLIDLAFFGYRLFDRIDRNGGLFISRLKDSANPTITKVHQTWRGRARPMVGKKVQQAMVGLKRHIIDMQVEVEVKRRIYRGQCRKVKHTFRLVGIRHPETGTYHLYMTNIPPSLLSARQIAAIYTARWMVELLFDQLKTHYRLEDLPSGQPHIVQTLIYAVILTWMADQKLTQSFLKHAMTASRRQAAVLAAFSTNILKTVIKQLGLYQGTCSLTRLIQLELKDPNRKQRLLLQRAGMT